MLRVRYNYMEEERFESIHRRRTITTYNSAGPWVDVIVGTVIYHFNCLRAIIIAVAVELKKFNYRVVYSSPVAGVLLPAG